MIDQPTIYNEHPDIERLNGLLDQVTSKPFLDPTLAIRTVRAALDLYGITLPIIDEVEQKIAGPQVANTAIDSTGNSPVEVSEPTDGGVELLYNIEDADGPDGDADDGWYLYLCIERDVETGFWEAYAQVVQEDDAEALINMDPEELQRSFPDLIGDVSGETEYEKQIRHTMATSKEKD